MKIYKLMALFSFLFILTSCGLQDTKEVRTEVSNVEMSPTDADSKRENEKGAGETVYQHITLQTKIWDVIENPAFGGRGKLLFPWDEDSRYTEDMTMEDAPSLLLWHTNMDAENMVDCVNYLIDEVNGGNQILYDFYTEEEKAADPSKDATGLFFFRGEPDAPFAVVSAGGGFAYVGSLHGGFPLAMELNRHGYNAFVLKYRVGMGETPASEDLIAAVDYIRKHAEELKVSPSDYSLWGGSAGARISGNVSYADGGIKLSEKIHPAAVLMAYTTFAETATYEATDSPCFMIAGTNDWIVPKDYMPMIAEKMRDVGIDVECTILSGVQHGFGTGKGMEAEGWMEDAIEFWEKHMVEKKNSVNETKIILTVGETKMTGKLNDTVAAQDFASKLPITVSVNKSSLDYCGMLQNGKIDESEMQYGWKNGDIGHARGWFALFHSDMGGTEYHEMIIGYIDSEYLDTLAGFDEAFNITIDRAE